MPESGKSKIWIYLGSIWNNSRRENENADKKRAASFWEPLCISLGLGRDYYIATLNGQAIMPPSMTFTLVQPLASRNPLRLVAAHGYLAKGDDLSVLVLRELVQRIAKLSQGD